MSYENTYWPIFISVMGFFSGIAFVCSISKKMSEKYKDYKIQQNIQVNLEPVLQASGSAHVSISSTTIVVQSKTIAE